jgi:hypothetical protein
MSANPDVARPENESDLHAQDALYYRDILHRILAVGADMMEMVQTEAKARIKDAVPGATPAADAAIAYDRIARSMRRTILLARKVAEPVKAPDARAAPDRVAARKQIIRKIEDAIYRDGPEDAAESLKAEFLERLDAPEFEDDLGQRPIGEIIDEICRDLGIAGQIGLNFWKRRTPEDVAWLSAYAARPRGAAPMPREDSEPPLGPAEEPVEDWAVLLGRFPRPGVSPSGQSPPKPGDRRR